MKDQYFGDINDYRKYGLLRVLQSECGLDLLVAWMLTPDDGGTDGMKRSYLQAPETWAHYDPELFYGLVELLGSAPRPSVSLIQGTDLLPGASYYADLVPDKSEQRHEWRRGLLESARGKDLVFLDPDNGIEVKSKPIGRKGSNKYVTWQEISDLWKCGCSVLVYQHFRRENRVRFAKRVISNFYEFTDSRFVQGFQTSNVLFILAAQSRHQEKFKNKVDVVSRQWNEEIVPMEMLPGC